MKTKCESLIILFFFVLFASCSKDEERINSSAGNNSNTQINTTAVPKQIYPGQGGCLEKNESIKNFAPQAVIKLTGGEIVFIAVIKRWYSSPVLIASNESGEILWSRWIEQTGGDISLNIGGAAALPDGGFVISASGGKKYATLNRLIKFSSTGDIEWEQELGRVSWESGSHRSGGPVVVRNQDILICGKDVFKPWSGTADIHDIVIYRVNFDGTGIEGVSIPVSDVSTRYNVVNMRERTNKDICITGYTSNAYFFLELTKGLDFKKMTLHELKNEKMTFKEMEFLSDGNVIIAGYTSMNGSIESSNNPNRFIFVKTNAYGNPLWTKAYDAPAPLCNIIFDRYNTPNIPVFVSETPSGTCLIQTACLSGSDAYAYKTGHVFAIDHNGNHKWGRSLRPDTASFFGPGYINENGEHLLMASTKEFCKTDSTISLVMIPSLTEGFNFKGSQKADLTFASNHSFTTDTIIADTVTWNNFNPTTRNITRDCELAIEQIK
jgi:hypothetical protein